jgi:acylphosphatase
MPEAPTRAFDVRIGGMVQGVGFRYSALRRAQALGISGWVRNEDDGSVSIHAEGSPDGLDAFAEWLREGPPGARVTEFSLAAASASGYYTGFSVEF